MFCNINDPILFLLRICNITIITVNSKIIMCNASLRSIHCIIVEL